jgi:peptidylprolyl isomerase
MADDVTGVKQGDTVKVDYTGTLDDGSIFDSSEGRTPLEFTVGAGQVIQGFEDAVIGLTVGDSVDTSIKAENAYGAVREDMIQEINRDKIPADMDPKIGQQLQFTLSNGQPITVIVKDLASDSITIDGNHPMAGKDLNFKITVVEIV